MKNKLILEYFHKVKNVNKVAAKLKLWNLKNISRNSEILQTLSEEFY